MNSLFNTPFTYAGLRIHTYYPAPKVVVGHFWWLSDELRIAMQARMVTRFGYAKSVIAPGQALRMKNDVFMHPADVVKLRDL